MKKTPTPETPTECPVVQGLYVSVGTELSGTESADDQLSAEEGDVDEEGDEEDRADDISPRKVDEEEVRMNDDDEVNTTVEDSVAFTWDPLLLTPLELRVEMEEDTEEAPLLPPVLVLLLTAWAVGRATDPHRRKAIQPNTTRKLCLEILPLFSEWFTMLRTEVCGLGRGGGESWTIDDSEKTMGKES